MTSHAYLNPVQSSANALAATEQPDGATRRVADFIVRTRWEDVPADVVTLGKKHLLDAFGLALAGQHAGTAPLVAAYFERLGVAGRGATVLGTNLRLPPRFAAFANAAAIHAHDFDDTQLAIAKDRAYGLLTHPTVTSLPPVLALAEGRRTSGRALMLAFHVAMEVQTKIAEASGPRSYRSGFHSTGVFGVFGAAAGAAKVAGLELPAVLHALGLAGAHASGLIENIGSMAKPFQAGHSAEGGVVAADLAALGWTATPHVLEGRRGFFTAHAGEFDESVFDTLGRTWTLASPGVSIKPYPCGSQLHAAMDAMLDLVQRHDLQPRQVRRVRVGCKQAMLNTLTHYRPQTGTQAKFSMQYCIAALLHDRRAGLAEFEDAAVQRPALQALLPRVELYRDERADAAGDDKLRSYVEVTLDDGRVLQGEPLDFAHGSPHRPMSYEDVAVKFAQSAAHAGVPAARARQIAEAVDALERCNDIDDLLPLLRG